MISGCADAGTSADAWIEKSKKFSGALTWAFLDSLQFAEKYMRDMTWKDIVEKMRFKLLENNYDQVPHLSVADRKLINTTVEFIKQ